MSTRSSRARKSSKSRDSMDVPSPRKAEDTSICDRSFAADTPDPYGYRPVRVSSFRIVGTKLEYRACGDAETDPWRVINYFKDPDHAWWHEPSEIILPGKTEGWLLVQKHHTSLVGLKPAAYDALYPKWPRGGEGAPFEVASRSRLTSSDYARIISVLARQWLDDDASR